MTMESTRHISGLYKYGIFPVFGAVINIINCSANGSQESFRGLDIFSTFSTSLLFAMNDAVIESYV